MSRFRELEKAIGEVLLLLSSFCGAATIAEDEVERLIQHTENFVEKAKEPGSMSGFSEQQWRAYQADQAEAKRILSSPALLSVPNPTQAKRLQDLGNQFPSPTQHHASSAHSAR